jgi:hypothetical protein
MIFNEFKNNVEVWANIRGIYDESSEAHQKAKALEEVGEYFTAKDANERMDAIGDIAVCIVNAAYLSRSPLYYRHSLAEGLIPKAAASITRGNYQNAISSLINVCDSHEYIFSECLELAWNEIKDRKGMMIGGKYVKWENLSQGERAVFNSRCAGNT